MPLVIEEVVGELDAQAIPRQQTDNVAPPAANNEHNACDTYRDVKTLMRQREERLRAD